MLSQHTYVQCDTGYRELYWVSVAINKMCTSITTDSIIVLFIVSIYVAPAYSPTTYFIAPPPAQVHECTCVKQLVFCTKQKT